MDDILESVTELARSLATGDVAGPDTDLRAAGLGSLRTVEFMLALEDAYAVSFPDHLVDASTFRTPRAAADVVARLVSSQNR